MRNDSGVDGGWDMGAGSEAAGQAEHEAAGAAGVRFQERAVGQFVGSDARTYTRYKVVRGHFDFATSAGMTIHGIETLPRGASDHLPIVVTSSYREAETGDAAA